MASVTEAPRVAGFVVTPHAQWEIRRRGLDLELVRAVLVAPQQRIVVRVGREVWQSRHSPAPAHKLYLIRVVVDLDRAPRDRDGVQDEPHREVLEVGRMKASYDARTDTVSLVLKVGAQVAESDEPRPGVILDFDAAGDLVSLEILDASRRVTDADRMEFQTAD